MNRPANLNRPPDSSAGAQPLLLLADTQITPRIYVLGGDQSPVVGFAAAELGGYLERITGHRVSVVEEPSAQQAPRGTHGMVVLSGAQHAPAPPSTQTLARYSRWLADLGELASDDAYAMTTEAADAVFLAGSGPRGLLYAVYDLLQRCGIRFFAPAYDYYRGHNEHVPRRHTLELPRFSTRQQAAFSLRRKYVEEGWSHTGPALEALVDWMAKCRLNVLVHPFDYAGEGVVRWDEHRDRLIPALARRGILLEVGGHGYESFLPAHRHPEHYEGGSAVFDVHRDSAVQAYVEQVVAYLRDRPEISIFDAWPPDDVAWPDETVRTFDGVANAHAHVTNALRDAVDRADLDVRVEGLAYAQHVEPPSRDYQPSAGSIIDFAPYDRSYTAPVYEQGADTNADYLQLARRWRSAFDGDMGMYEYYRKYSWHSLPVPLLGLIAGEVPYYKAVGFSGLGTYSEPDDWVTYEVVHLLVAELSWNTELHTAQWLRSYLSQRYGDAAPGVATYLTQAERAARQLFDRADGAYDSIQSVRAALECYRSAADALRSALRSTGSPGHGSALWLLSLLVSNLEYAIADTELEVHRLCGNRVAHEAAAAHVAELVGTLRGKGVVVDSVWVRQRLDRATTREDCRWIYHYYRGVE